MQIKHEIYLTFIIIVNLFLYNCAGSSSEVINPAKSNQTQIENNKVKVSVEQQKNKIIDTVEKGYLLGEKVIRHAKVVVAN